MVHPLGRRSNQRAHGDLCAILAAIHRAKLLITNIALAGELLLCSNVFDAQSSLSIVAMERIDDAGFFRWFSFSDVTVNGDGGLAGRRAPSAISSRTSFDFLRLWFVPFLDCILY